MSLYEPLDMNEVMAELNRVTPNEAENNNEDYLKKFVKMPDREGFVVVRILPRKKGGKLFCATRTHTLKNPSTGQTRAYHCPKELVMVERNGQQTPQWKGDCFICKYYSDLWQKSEKAGTEEKELLQNKAREIKPVERYYYNVIVRQEKDDKGQIQKNVGPKIWSIGKKVHAKVMRAIVGDKAAGEEPLGDVTHPLVGRDFKIIKKISKSGTYEYPNYDNSKFEEPSSAASTTDELDRWIDNVHDLQALRKLKTEDELKQALRVHLGMVQESEEKKDDSDLDEFRNASSGVTKNVETSVREELLTTEYTSTPSSNVTNVSDDILADDDFMKELESV